MEIATPIEEVRVFVSYSHDSDDHRRAVLAFAQNLRAGGVRTVVVHIGAETATRRWVRFEITKAWNEKRGIVGVRVHGLADGNQKSDHPGPNPFSEIGFQSGGTVADYVPVYDPVGLTSQEIYGNIRLNLVNWVASAYKRS
jgi:hypothetical protein